MFKIVRKQELNANVTLMEIEAPFVAKKAKAGQFIIFRIDEKGERVPLTIAGYDREKGTVTIIFQKIGKSTYELGELNVGDILLDFAGTIFKNPENYTYAIGNNTVTKQTGPRTTTYYYFSYILAFNTNEFHIVSFRSNNHTPVFRNIITFDFSEMQLTHKRKKKSLELQLYCAGEKQKIKVSDIVFGTNTDKSDTPFAVEQAREVELLEQMVMQYELRSYEIQKGLHK